jgi:hypothetical protein
MIVNYREKAASTYLARSRRYAEARAFRRFKFIVLLFLTVIAFAVWFITH